MTHTIAATEGAALGRRGILLVLLCGACGSRTGLLSADPDSGTEPAPHATRCKAPAPAHPLRIPQGTPDIDPMLGRTVLASSGCSYAEAWASSGADATAVNAVVFRVVDGAWQASPVARVALAGDYLADAWITWNGAVYVVAWDDGSSLFIRTLGDDGVPVGEPRRLFAFPPTSFIVGVEADEAGFVRIGMGLSPLAYQAKGYFAKVTLDGRVVLPPTLVTPGAQVLNGAAFLFGGAGLHKVLHVGGDPPSVNEYLTLSTFDDEGEVSGVEALATRTNGSIILVGAPALVMLGSDLYYGLAYSNGEAFEPYVVDATRGTRVRLPMGSAPEIVTLGDSTLDALMTPIGAERDLDVVRVTDDSVGAKTIAASGSEIRDAAFFSIAAGKESVGVAWTSEDAVYFTTLAR